MIWPENPKLWTAVIGRTVIKILGYLHWKCYDLKKLKCWEFMRCDREAGGRNVDHLGVCPAYPYHGQECANVVGTFCDLVQALRTTSLADCQECPFYNSMHFNQSARRVNGVIAL